MTKILDGKHVSQQLRNQIKEEVEDIKNKGGKIPHLAAILVGDDGASQTYVNHKVKDCAEVGFDSTLKKFEASVSENEILNEIQKINENPDIDGLIVQLPLPAHISSQKVLDIIKPEKDVDGFHPVNSGRMLKGLPSYIAATPLGILKLIEYYKLETDTKHCVVMGRSDIVGKPMSVLMGRKGYPGNCTVTLCHSRTPNLGELTATADILIVAMGVPEFVSGNMVKEGAVVIDVGTTRVPDKLKKSGYSLKGDVNFDQVAPKASYITPVPGGVGPMTRFGLLWNTLLAAKKEIFP